MAEVTPGAVAPVAPAATPAPEIVSTAEEITDSLEGGEHQPEPPPEKTLTQSEVNKLIAKEKAKEQRRTEKALRDGLRAEVELEYLRKQSQPPQPQADRASGEPQEKDFKTYEDWLIAKAKYDVREELKREQAERERETATQRAHREAKQRADTMREKLAAAAEEFPDIEDVVQGDVPFTEPMVAFFEDMDAPARLIHHLGTNVKEASRIAALSPAGQFRELVKLEATLSAAPKPTQTPAPIVPNKGNSSGTRSMLELNQEDFEARRKAYLAKKGR